MLTQTPAKGQKVCYFNSAAEFHKQKYVIGPNRDLNPGPPAPKAGIIPLDHLASLKTMK